MRPEVLNPLFKSVADLKGVGPAMAKRFERLDVTRVRDLLFHMPVALLERTRCTSLAEARPHVGYYVTLKLTVVEHQEGRGRAPLRILMQDDDGELLTLVYFSNPGQFLSARLPIGAQRWVSGQLDSYSGRLQMVHPDHIETPERGHVIAQREPVYPLTEGITNSRMRAILKGILDGLPKVPEWLDPPLAAREGWTDWVRAITSLHADPMDQQARRRLAYDELLSAQLALALVRARSRRKRTQPRPGTGVLTTPLLESLAFSLTGAQRRCVAEIAADMSRPAAMLRMLQGDVGSGKTLVALLAMLQVVEAGGQAALLAPTEILARQHYATLQSLLAGLPVRVELLTGRDKGKARAATLERLQRGEVSILVGTHAIFQQAVGYDDLGLVVIDEQHRFGVQQRIALAEKGNQPPHVLVMTATPIPRTLALALYGDMDISVIDERPPGRQPIDTRVVALERLEEVYAGLGRAIADGVQAYWVCPLVEQSELVDMAAAEDRAADLEKHFGNRVGLVHGRMAGKDKDAVMAAFSEGALSVLVATTVIEVGVDVPNATLMVIEQAERFGLAQLHQLRGRVGRGQGKSTCLLLRGAAVSETARARLMMMRETDDGFRIAEEDLRLRGSGDLLGTKQSGLPAFQIADLGRDSDLLAIARVDARKLVEDSAELSGPRGAALRVLLYLHERDAAISLLQSG